VRRSLPILGDLSHQLHLTFLILRQSTLGAESISAATSGAAWNQAAITDSLNGLNVSGTSNAAFIGGGQVGANYQINWAVVGVEGTFDWAANNNNTSNGVFVPALNQTV
jgi:hypothetical protein